MQKLQTRKTRKGIKWYIVLLTEGLCKLNYGVTFAVLRFIGLCRGAKVV